MKDDKMGPNSASLNASIPLQPRRRDAAPGGSGRDAQAPAGIETGCFEKERFAMSAGTEILGKDIEPMGQPPWSAPLKDTGNGSAVSDTFGSGQRHTIKNG